jgi:hypothetical protein
LATLCWKKIEIFKNYLYQDYEEYLSKVQVSKSNVEKQLKIVDDTMNSIYDSIYELSGIDDIIDVLNRIDSVLKYDINPNDAEDFEELKSYLTAVKTDIFHFEMQYQKLNRVDLLAEYTQLSEKYLNSEYNVISVVDFTYIAILRTIDSMAEGWEHTYLRDFNYSDCSIEVLLKWKENTKVLPEFLTDKIKVKYQEIALEVEKRLSQNHIDTALQIFKNLTDSEKKEFLMKVHSIYSIT